MNAYVAITDHDLFRLLAGLPSDERHEVNFWTPSPWGGRFRVLTEGEPLLFKLRSEHGGFKVGGGFFARYTELPITWAWGAFGRVESQRVHDDSTTARTTCVCMVRGS